MIAPTARGPLSPSEQLASLEAIIRADPDLMLLLATLRGLGLPQWRLGGGCIYQTVWNVLTARPRRTGIKDYDCIYFDPDPSWEAEDAVICRVAAATAGFPGVVEVRNQARVHLWFEQRFGQTYEPLTQCDDAFRRYASVVHAVGVRLEDDGGLDVVAPFGLDDLFDLVIRPNKLFESREGHETKAARAQSVWPEVSVIPWDG